LQARAGRRHVNGGLAFGVFFIVVGGIFSFTTLDNSLLKENLDVVGYICIITGVMLIIGGLIEIIFGTIQNRKRANTSHTSVVERRNIEEGNVQDDVHEVRDDNVQDDVHEVRDDRRDV